MHVYHGDIFDSKYQESKTYIQINSCGKGISADYDYLVERKIGRADLHILYVISGEIEAVYNDKVYTMHKGNFILYPKNMPQSYIRKKNTVDFWVHFNGYHVDEILNDAHLYYGVHNAEYSQEVEQIFIKLITEYVSNQSKSISINKGFLISLIYLLGNVEMLNEGINNCDILNNALIYLASNFQSNITNDMLASICNISTSYFSHLFKLYTGVSPHKYQQNLRIENSKMLLLSTNLSVKEISILTGYDDALYFSRIFKNITGCYPTQYRTLKNHKIDVK